MAGQYTVGDTVACWTEWRALVFASLPAKVWQLADPTTLTVEIEAPDETVTTPTPVLVSTGIYYVTFEVTQAGRYVLTWTGTGSAAGVEQQVVDVTEAA